jgi:alpha-mannosidase
VSDGTLAINVTAPALGLAPLTPRPVDDRVVVTESSMTNRHLAVRWDDDGWLTSVIDIARAREVLPEGERSAVLELAGDRPVEYDAWDLESWTRAGGRPVDGDVDVTLLDAGPLVGRVQVRRSVGPSTFVVTYELRAHACELLIDIEIDWHHDEHLLSMAFPIDVRADEAACDVQFGVARRPTHPSSPWDAAKFEVCAHRFVDLSEPSFGVAVLNDGRYGHCVFDGAVRVSLARAAKYPDPEADLGRHNVTLALLPHGPGLGEVRAAASRLNAPPRVVVDGAGAGRTAPIVRVVGADGGDPCVGMDAVKLADDGSGDLIVRLHEACGDRTPITVGTVSRIREAWRCNLMEDPQRGEEVGDGALTLTLRPFELVTLRLRLGEDFDGRDRSG